VGNYGNTNDRYTAWRFFTEAPTPFASPGHAVFERIGMSYPKSALAKTVSRVGTKVCRRCSKRRQKKFYYASKQFKDGLDNWCKVCKNDAHVKWRTANRGKYRGYMSTNRSKRALPYVKFLVEYLEAHPCVDCTESNVLVLQFDHVRGVKSFELGVMSVLVAKTLVEVAREVRKCDVRCANCHQLRSLTVRRTMKYKWVKEGWRG
jgi:hypothetical protein